MPSKSPAQARMMAAVAHSPGFAKKVGIPMSVGRDFNRADTGTRTLSRANRHPVGPNANGAHGRHTRNHVAQHLGLKPGRSPY